MPARLRPATAQIGRLTIAAVVAYLVADLVRPGILDLTAPLTALLVVQASTVGTLQMGLVRVGAVLTGVLVAVGLASTIGLSWWSLALVITASLVLARVLRLGDQSLETPISAMLILAVSAPEMAAEGRVLNTLIGTVIGIGFSVLVPVSIPSARATSAVRRVAHAQAALLDEVALTLADRSPHPEEVGAWIEWIEDIDHDVDAAAGAVQALEDSRRLNARALAAAKIHPGLRAALDRFDRCLAAERALVVVIGRESSDDGSTDTPADTELRRAFAVVLDDVADAVRGSGDLVSAQFGGASVDRVDEMVARTADAVRETRAVLTELLLLDVDPRRQTPLWMLQGSVLAAVEQILLQLDPVPADPRQLDPAFLQPITAAWLTRYRASEGDDASGRRRGRRGWWGLGRVWPRPPAPPRDPPG